VVSQQAAGAPQWPSRRRLEEKFTQHRRDFSGHLLYGPLYNADDYDNSARETIQDGVRFTYTDIRAGRPRVGYFDPPTERFTATTADGRWVLTHYPAEEDYVRDLPDSDYP
jgi:hypothetical protein